MIESSFFWLMLLGSVLVYWSLPIRLRLWFLALVSITYLAIVSPRDVKIHSYTHAAILTALALLCYRLAPITANKASPRWIRRTIFWGLILLVLGYMCFAKYVLTAGWFHGSDLRNYALPLGISYLCFKLIHMTVDSARDPSKYRSLGAYLCNLFLFPITPAGPIERYDHFVKNHSDRFSADDLLQGVTRIVYGLIKRFVIAESLFAESWRFVTHGALFEQLHRTSSFELWKAAIYVFLYLYLDFSAYTDIAIGCCRLFGIQIMENFDWPILAPNIAVFWKRWHMTLTSWCQTYVYMPLVGMTRKINFSIFMTFVVIGLWHGSTRDNLPWLLWGIYNGIGMILYQYWARLKRAYKWAWCGHWLWYGTGVALTTLFVSLGTFLALTGPDSFSQAGDILRQMAFVHRHEPASLAVPNHAANRPVSGRTPVA